MQGSNLRPSDGAGERIRTLDPLITSQMLYQLSYTGIYIGLME